LNAPSRAESGKSRRLRNRRRENLEGRLKLNTWTGKDGTQQAGLSVAASLVQPMGQIGAKRPRKPKVMAGRTEDFAPLGSAESSAQLNDPIPF
jgi:hypothetical protein